MTTYMMLEGCDADILGLLPDIFRESDPRSAAEQANDRYVGGWRPMRGFEEIDGKLCYPDDPPLKPLAAWILHGEEMVVLYEYGFVAIYQRTGRFEVSRMD